MLLVRAHREGCCDAITYPSHPVKSDHVRVMTNASASFTGDGVDSWRHSGWRGDVPPAAAGAPQELVQLCRAGSPPVQGVCHISNRSVCVEAAFPLSGAHTPLIVFNLLILKVLLLA